MEMWTSKFEGKKIVLLGFGREGRSTYDFIQKYVKRCSMQVMDTNVSYVMETLGDALEHVKVYSEEAYLKFDQDVDLVFKSPGIPLKQIEHSIEAEKITSQSNEFIEQYRDQIVGITGTKGKSTVSTFVTELLKAASQKVELVGNIGKPAFDYVDLEADAEGEKPIYVYELSSHQLETVSVSPAIGVVLNLFEEHLDHYHSYNHYAEAKMNIGRFQKENDVFIYSHLDEEIAKRLSGFRSSRFQISSDFHSVEDLDMETVENGIYVRESSVLVKYDSMLMELLDSVERKLEGKHNLINMAVGLLIYRILGYTDEHLFDQVFKSFEGLPHRLARVAEVDGVVYYNDSISTIPQATIAAVEAIPKTETIIIGGMDRGIDYSSLLDYLAERNKLKCILLPDTGHKLYNEIEQKERLYKVEELKEAVVLAAQITSTGRACILSPAAPSYGFFKNFEDRGNQYEASVRALKS